MFFLRRIMIFFLPLLLTIDLLLIFLKNQFIPLTSGFIGGSLIILLGTYFLIKEKITSWKKILTTVFLPVLLFVAGIFYLLFMEAALMKTAIIILINLLLLLYLKELFKQLEVLPAPSLERQQGLLLLIEVVIVFFMASGLYGLRDFLSISFVYLIIIFAVLMFLLINYFIFLIEKINLNKTLYSLILTLVMTELFIATTIFSLLYYLKGLLISIGYLLIMKIIVAGQTAQVWSRKMIYLAVAISVILALVLLSSRWF